MSQDAVMMTKKMLMDHEGYSAYPYLCPTKYITIGYGRNLETTGITKGEAMRLLVNDIEYHAKFLYENFDFFYGLCPARQSVLVNMCYNLGRRGFMKFKRMLAALSRSDFDYAAKEMLDSKWARQVKHRAKQLAHIMRTGEAP